MYRGLPMVIACLIAGTIVVSPDTAAQTGMKSLRQLRLEDDAGHWLSVAAGYKSGSLQYEYRMKGDPFGVLAGVQFWSSNEPLGALKLSSRLRLPTNLVTPHLTLGLMGVVNLGTGLGPHVYYALGFDVNANAWLHPYLEAMRTSIKNDRFIFQTGISVRLARPS